MYTVAGVCSTILSVMAAKKERGFYSRLHSHSTADEWREKEWWREEKEEKRTLRDFYRRSSLGRAKTQGNLAFYHL